jgi:hypothetical protein
LLSNGKVIGGIYIALSSALSDEGLALANGVLYRIANDPRTPPKEAHIYNAIADSVGVDVAAR